jgi:hypothetical protein
MFTWGTAGHELRLSEGDRKAAYHKQVSGRLFPPSGTTLRTIQFHVSETEELLGWKFKSFEEQVRSVADHYIKVTWLASERPTQASGPPY